MKQQYEDLDTGAPRQTKGRGLFDALLVSLCVCLLLALGVMLRPQRGSPSAAASPTPDVPVVTPARLPDVLPDVPTEETPADEGPRERLMSLGFALLLVSLGVCLYVMYRLGFCCNRREYNHVNRARLRSGIPSVNSRLHLISAVDLPPAYDAIMLSSGRDVQPPPYFTIITFHEEDLAKLPPAYVHAASRGCAGCSAGAEPSSSSAGAAAAASRPQEAG